MYKKILQLYSLKQFYRNNQYTLLKIWDRPLWLGIFSMLFQYYFCFFVMMNEEVLRDLEQKDYNIKHLRKFSIQSESLLSHRTLIFLFLGFNIALIIYLIVLFIKYLIQPYSNLSQPILSVCIQNYNIFVTLPSLYYSLEILNIYSYINIPLTLLLGFLSSKHQAKYSLEKVDSLSKQNPFQDFQKFLLLIAYVFSGIVINKRILPGSYLIVLAIKIIHLFLRETHYNKKISLLDYQLALTSFVWCIIILLGEFSKSGDYLLFWMLVSTPLTFKFAQIFMKYKQERRINFFLQNMNGIDWKNDVTISDFDFFIRNIWQDLNSKKRVSMLEDTSAIHCELIIYWHIQSCQKRPFCFCQDVSEITKSNLVKEYLLESNIRRQFLVDYMHELFHRFLQQQKNFNPVHFEYLYFLKECSKNEPLLNIKLFEYYKRFKQELSSQNISTIEYLISLQQKNSKKSLNIFDVITFDENLQTVGDQLLNVLDQKQLFLRSISEDYIILQDLELQGVNLCKRRNQLQEELKRLNKINPDNIQLSFLISNYLCCLSFDDSKDIFFSKARYQLQDKFVKTAFSKNSSVVFISLLKDEFAHIKYVSNSFLSIFSYEKKNIVGKNVATLISKNIAIHHDKILSNFIERGFFEEQKLRKLQPLYALNSNGFLIQVNLNLQITLAGLDQIGVSGLIEYQKNSSNDYVILTDLINDHLVQGCTKKVYTDFFQEYLEKQEEQKNIYLTQCIPLLPHIIKQQMLEENSKNDNDNSSNAQVKNQRVQIIKLKKIETVAFLPKNTRNGLSRLFIKPFDIDTMIRNGQLSLLMNDLYVVSFKVQLTIDEYLNAGQINLKSFKKIENIESQIDCIKLLFLEQVKQYCPKLSYSEQDIQTLFLLQNWQSQIYTKINQIIDKYSHHHQSFTNLNSPKKNVDSQIEQIQEEQEDLHNQSQQTNEINILSYRNLNDQGGQDLQKEELILSMHRNIGSSDNLVFNGEKNRKQSPSQRQIYLPQQETLSSYRYNENLQLQQIYQQGATQRDVKSNATTNVFSQISFQSPKQKETKTTFLNSQREVKLNFNQSLNKKQSQEDTTNFSNQTHKKVHSKQSNSQNMNAQNNNENEKMINQLQLAHEQSVSSSRNSQHSTQKKIIKNSFEHHSRNRVFQYILFLAMVSLTIVGLVILIFFLSLEHLFELQKSDFYYIPWGMNLRISVSRIFKDHIFEKFCDIEDFGFTNQKSILKPQFNQAKFEIFQYYKDQILEIVQEPLIDLFLLQHITKSDMEIRFYQDEDIFQTLVIGIQHALDFYGINMFQMANYDINDPNTSDRVIMINLFNNFLTMIKDLANIQTLQEENISYTYDQIEYIVLILLFVICLICFIFILTIFPTFSYAQMKKQRIFNLFSTIDPQRIKQMHKLVLISIQSISLQRNKVSQKYLLSASMSQASKLIVIKDNLLINKKKSISATSLFPRYSLSLVVKCFIVYTILIVYPVVNFIITKALTQQSSSNQTLQGIVQTAKAQISSNIATFALCTHSDLNLSNDFRHFPKYQVRFLNVLKLNPEIFSKFQTAIQEQEQKGRYNSQEYTDFFFNIITSNSCEVVKKYPQYFNSTILNYNTCNSAQNGVLKEGLLSAINIYSNFFVNAYEIYQIEDKAKRYQSLIQLVSNNHLLEINDLYELIIEFMVGLTKFVVENNKSFFDQMNMIQTILMVYQFVVLVLVYHFGLVSFFRNTTNELRRAKNVLTAFEITYLIENSYILNYLTK